MAKDTPHRDPEIQRREQTKRRLEEAMEKVDLNDHTLAKKAKQTSSFAAFITEETIRKHIVRLRKGKFLSMRYAEILAPALKMTAAELYGASESEIVPPTIHVPPTVEDDNILYDIDFDPISQSTIPYDELHKHLFEYSSNFPPATQRRMALIIYTHIWNLVAFDHRVAGNLLDRFSELHNDIQPVVRIIAHIGCGQPIPPDLFVSAISTLNPIASSDDLAEFSPRILLIKRLVKHASYNYPVFLSDNNTQSLLSECHQLHSVAWGKFLSDMALRAHCNYINLAPNAFEWLWGFHQEYIANYPDSALSQLSTWVMGLEAK